MTHLKSALLLVEGADLRWVMSENISQNRPENAIYLFDVVI
jgi:hypothetical protein